MHILSLLLCEYLMLIKKKSKQLILNNVWKGEAVIPSKKYILHNIHFNIISSVLLPKLTCG